MTSHFVFLLSAFAAGSAAAQAGARPDPTAARAAVPRIEYRSAFEGYRPLADEKAQAWRESNERVQGAGGRAARDQRAPAQDKPKGERK